MSEEIRLLIAKYAEDDLWVGSLELGLEYFDILFHPKRYF
jgi:hypothetical protein